MNTRQDIERIIQEEDVEFIRLQFTDAFGNLKNIAVTPSQLDRVLQNKFSFAGEALFDGKVECNEDLYLYPDPDTFVIIPWRPQSRRVAKIICDVCYEDGTLVDMSPRTILKKVTDEAASKGYSVKVSSECEFFLFHTDDNGNPTVVTHEQGGYMDVGPSDFGENARRDIVLTLEDMGIRVQSSYHEKAPAQHEIDLCEVPVVDAADAVTTFRFAVRSLAKRFGLYATFMPKPKSNAAGSGLHLQVAMYKDGRNIFESEDGISAEAKGFIGGILKHAKAIAGITNPIVNSYKRINNGCDAPGLINWSVRGEKCLVKYTRDQGTPKVELRFPDGAANPYLALAVCLAAGLEGIDDKTDPGNMDSTDCVALPADLKHATEELNRDELVKSVLGNDFAEAYTAVKDSEWNEYISEVSEWEINRYLSKM